MPVKRTRKKKITAKQQRDYDLAVKSLELNQQMGVINLQKALLSLKEHCLIIENDHNELKKKLTALLDQDQIEAAKITGCSPEIYALEWIQLCKDRVRELTPAYTGQAMGLIKQGYA